MKSFGLILLLLLSACREPEIPLSAGKSEPIKAAPSLAKAKRAAKTAALAEEKSKATAPAKMQKEDEAAEAASCATDGVAVPLWNGFSVTRARRFQSSSLIASYVRDGSGESLRVVDALSKTILVERPLKFHSSPRWAPPELFEFNGDAYVAFVDRDGKLFVQNIASKKPILITKRKVDIRFSPALYSSNEELLVAWTSAESNLIVRKAKVEAARESEKLVPTLETSAAPYRGADGAIYFVDPRESLSIVCRFAKDFKSKEVASPLRGAFDPATFLPLRVGGKYWVAYTAIGKASMTAIGLQQAGRELAALVPSASYGPLRFDGAKHKSGAIFAVDVPLAEEKVAPRKVSVFSVIDSKIDHQFDIASAKGRAHFPSLLPLDDERFMLIYTDDSETFAQMIQCK